MILSDRNEFSGKFRFVIKEMTLNLS